VRLHDRGPDLSGRPSPHLEGSDLRQGNFLAWGIRRQPRHMCLGCRLQMRERLAYRHVHGIAAATH